LLPGARRIRVKHHPVQATPGVGGLRRTGRNKREERLNTPKRREPGT
jgi:hypothetical protein